MIRKKYAVALILTATVVTLGIAALRERNDRPAQPARPMVIAGAKHVDTETPALPSGIIWPGGRYETRAGFSVELPVGAIVKEEDEDVRYEIGKARKVRVTGPSGESSFVARLVSADFGIAAGEGCCDEFHGALDLSATESVIRDALVASFREIYGMRLTLVGGRRTVRFISPFRYADTVLLEHVLIPTGEVAFPMLQFTVATGAAWGVDQLEPALDDAAVRGFTDQGPAASLTRMLDTIRFIPIPAQ